MNNIAANDQDLQQDTGVLYAGFKRRLNAATIDMLVFVIVIFCVFGGNSILSPEIMNAQNQVLSSGQGNTEAADNSVVRDTVKAEAVREAVAEIAPIMIRNSLYQFVLIAFIVIPFWYYKGATIGKMIYAMKIVDAKTMARASLKQCIIRFLAYIISLVVVCIGFFAIAYDDEKRGWHDKIAGTMVIHLRDLDSQSEKDKKFKRDTILVLVFIGVFLIYSLVK